MAKKPLEIVLNGHQEDVAKYISFTWSTYYTQKLGIITSWKELRNYIFATDTRTTTNDKLPWKNSTTLPKLCQIRDNLHSNYISALFPNDDWLRWEAYDLEASIKSKRDAIQGYMASKTRESHFRARASTFLYDFIDYGNAFATVEYESSFRTDKKGNKIPDYTGPRAVRISPLDIVFNPLANSFSDSFKIIRKLVGIGELESMSQTNPADVLLSEALSKRRKLVSSYRHNLENSDKAEGIMVDGFGNYEEYLKSGYVEILTFYGDMYDQKTGTLETGRKISIIDRSFTIENKPYDSILGGSPVFHVGWRTRPDNLWAMGPLENLVGMQYRIDHLENLKSDAMDLAVMPPLVISGDVEQFTYGPGVEIHLDENGSVTELAKNVQWVIQADNSISMLEQRMEMYAGAPREAMGIRTAGEKTAFEVQSLNNAAGRIFQEKVTHFESEFLEPLLNAMLEVARFNLDVTDVIRVSDEQFGGVDFINITDEDLNASGKLRPIGARHFAAQANMMQTFTQLSGTPLWQQISPHFSAIKGAKLVEDILGLSRYGLFSPNQAVFEQQQTQRLATQAQEVNQAITSTPIPTQ